jgi:hypothetical protein
MGKVLIRLGLGGVVVLLAAFVIGCGGDDGDSSSGGDTSAAEETSTDETAAEPEEPEATQEDFVNAADEACGSKTDAVAQVLKQSAAAQKVATSDETLQSLESVGKSADTVADLTEKLADLKREITKELAKLDTPDPQGLEQLVKSRDAAADDLDALADAWRGYGKDPTQKTSDAIATAQQQNLKSAKADHALADKLGLKVCGAAVEPAT